MSIPQIVPRSVACLLILLLSACQSQAGSNSPTATRSPTAQPTALPTVTEAATVPATSPATVPATPTIIVDLPPTETPEPTVQSDFVKRLCPTAGVPMGLFDLAEQVVFSNTEPETVFTLYQIQGLEPDTIEPACPLYLAPWPWGVPQLAGDNLFWQSFDHEAETVTVWQYDPLAVSENGVAPQHFPLPQTTIETSLGKAGLTSFITSDDGELLVWSYTDPQLSDDNQYAYVQTIYAISPNDPADQRPALELLFNVVPETDGQSHIIRLRQMSAASDRVYFSDEPIGLGTRWPYPTGHYSSLYSIDTSGSDVPQLHHHCSQEHWCISDFAEAFDLLVTVAGDGTEIGIRRLGDGTLNSTIQVPDGFDIVRQALIGPDGGIAFMAAAFTESNLDSPPTDVAIFYTEPPYTEDPVLLLRDAGIQNLLGWVSGKVILANGNPVTGNGPETFPLPSNLMLIDVTQGSGVWLPLDARRFIDLVR